MMDYDKMAREIWPPESFNVPNDLYMGKIAQALEGAALEGAIKELESERAAVSEMIECHAEDCLWCAFAETSERRLQHRVERHLRARHG
jgi:hypothetical protein